MEIKSFIVSPKTYFVVLWVTLQGSFCCTRIFWVRKWTKFWLWSLWRLFSYRLGCIKKNEWTGVTIIHAYFLLWLPVLFSPPFSLLNILAFIWIVKKNKQLCCFLQCILEYILKYIFIQGIFGVYLVNEINIVFMWLEYCYFSLKS